MRPLLWRTFPRSNTLLRVRYYWDSDSCQRSPRRQVSPLTSCHLPIVPSSNTLYAAAPLYPPLQRAALLPGFAEDAGSPLYAAESGSSSYGPTVRFRLLPTPPRDDAVTFSYGAVANSGRDFHPADGTPSRAYVGRGRRSPSPPSEPGVQFSRDGLSSQLFPHRDWRAD